ncbi:methyltransferase family protein [Lutibacter sp.]
MSKKSLILVILQFSSFAFFGLNTHLFAQSSGWLGIQLIGLGIGLWGIFAMKLGNFNIQPEVKNTAKFITKGPYKIIRNPMYTGIILFFGVSVYCNYTPLRLFVFLILSTVLILKISMEEQFLSKKFGEKYLEYKAKTYRLIPFIY